MTNTINHNRVNAKYILITLLAVLLSWVLHEFTHWLTGEALGYDMTMTLNTCSPKSGRYDPAGDYQLVSAAGPLFTLLEAIAVFILMKHRNTKWLYPFLFTCFYMRLQATIISFFNPNDEARISSYLGIGRFTLPLIIAALLFFLVYTISRQYGFGKKFNAINTAWVMLFTSAIILTDQALHVRLL